MNRPTPSVTEKARNKRGSALMVVVIFTTLISLIVGSLMSWGLTEMKLNEDAIFYLDAQNAAESTVEFGVGQLSYRWEAQTNFREGDLAPGENPITLSSSFTNLFPATSAASTDGRVYDTDLVGGVIEIGKLYIDPDDPANQDDPHRGKLVSVKSVNVYGRATVTDDSSGRTSRAYAVQTMQLRDAPLFSHAVFYNMDLEFHPGPSMVMNGPVHANGDIWLQAINSLTFEGALTATDHIRYGYMLSDTITQTGNVRINDGEGGYESPYKGSGSKSTKSNYWDSLRPLNEFEDAGYNDWRELAKNRWNGNVQDGAHDVPNLNPVGFNDYVRDNPLTADVDDDLNYGYAIIEPNIPAEDPTESGFKHPAHKLTGETEKFAYKAGVIIKVHYSSDGTTQHDGSPLPAHAVRLKSRPYQNVPLSTAYDDAADFDRNGDGNPDTISDFYTHYYISFNKVRRTDPHNNASALTDNHNLYVRTSDAQRYQVFEDDSGDEVYRDDDGDFWRKAADGSYVADAVSGTYTAKTETVSEIVVDPVEVDLTDNYVTQTHSSGVPILQYEFDQMFAAYEYNESGGDPTSSFYDPRRQTPVDAVEINLGMFKRQLEVYNGDTFTQSDGSSSYTPSDEYNGLVYVEFPTDTSSDVGPDGIVKSIRNSPRTNSAEMGLLLTNADEVPNPSYNQNNSGRDEGFTLATNNALYIKGHLNADGDEDTGSNTTSDDPNSPDPPVAVVADAVMPLSTNFLFENTREGLNSGDRNSTFTEFNAAILQGLRPTDKEGSGNISGGNHNFPRFLERWSNQEFRYRGSMVALFESEVAPQGTNTAFYSPPIRNWGFFDRFGSGHYPPGTPNVRSYRSINFRFISRDEWMDAITDEVYQHFLDAGYITQGEYNNAVAALAH